MTKCPACGRVELTRHNIINALGDWLSGAGESTLTPDEVKDIADAICLNHGRSELTREEILDVLNEWMECVHPPDQLPDIATAILQRMRGKGCR